MRFYIIVPFYFFPLVLSPILCSKRKKKKTTLRFQTQSAERTLLFYFYLPTSCVNFSNSSKRFFFIDVCVCALFSSQTFKIELITKQHPHQQNKDDAHLRNSLVVDTFDTPILSQQQHQKNKKNLKPKTTKHTKKDVSGRFSRRPTERHQ